MKGVRVMSDSVGKITLDLEVTSDIAGQVNKVSSTIANTLKSNLIILQIKYLITWIRL